MQYNDAYFNSDDSLPVCMYAANDPQRELVNPWDTPGGVSQVEMLVPSGVAAWPPVRCAVTVEREPASRWSPATTNPGSTSLFEGDVEYPAMPMMHTAQNYPEDLAAFDLEYPAMPMMPVAQDYMTIDSLEYPAMPMIDPQHGLTESSWTQTHEERRTTGTDARLIPYDELDVDLDGENSTGSSPSSSASAPSLSQRLAGLGFQLPEMLALVGSKGTALNEFQIALAFLRAAAAARNSDEFDSECDGAFENIDMDIDEKY